jgi:hypothetical protein
LTPKLIAMVEGSIACAGRASVTAGSQSVSATVAFGEARVADDVARLGLRRPDTLQPAEAQDLGHPDLLDQRPVAGERLERRVRPAAGLR